MYLGNRGLKIMRHTLYVYWTGQPVAWIALTLAFWAVGKSFASTVLAYAGRGRSPPLRRGSYGGGRRLASRQLPTEAGETGRLIRYGPPRAPAALLSQLLFWTDYFVALGMCTGPRTSACTPPPCACHRRWCCS